MFYVNKTTQRGQRCDVDMTVLPLGLDIPVSAVVFLRHKERYFKSVIKMHAYII